MKTIDKKKYSENLHKTLELTDLCYIMKSAYFKKKFSDKSDCEIEKMIYADYVRRKENEWIQAKTC